MTMCGEVKVPEDHLDVCRVCNAFGQNCGVVGDGQPGTGISNADFVFYISAMETERCQKGMTVAYAAHCQQEAALDRLVVSRRRSKNFEATPTTNLVFLAHEKVTCLIFIHHYMCPSFKLFSNCLKSS